MRKKELSTMLSTISNKLQPHMLGSESFRKRYGIRYAYLAGGMYKGIASQALVIAMGQAGLLGFLGTGGRDIESVECDVIAIKKALGHSGVFGVNLVSQLEHPELELQMIDMCLRHDVKILEASAFMQISEALVYYRVSGLSRNQAGRINCKNKIVAKLSRPEVAQKFLTPPPQSVVKKLLEEGRITAEQSQISQNIPMCSDICIEADSGGHTDRGIAAVILPSVQFLKSQLQEEFKYTTPVHIGLAGGIGVPQSAAAAFMMGADFILTGSINQCSIEAATSDDVKDMLQAIDVQDTDYAPAGDMFELGAQVQVLKKGSLFAARANKLYALYSQYCSWDELPASSKKQIEDKYFGKSFAQVWSEVQQYHLQKGNSQTLEKAQKSAKHKMALVFKKYFSLSNEYALQGNRDKKVDFQVHTGPSLGAFNQWVKQTPIEDWRNRHVDEIAEKLMVETAVFMQNQLNKLSETKNAQNG